MNSFRFALRTDGPAKLRCRPESGAEDARSPKALRRTKASRQREASGLRAIYRRFGSGGASEGWVFSQTFSGSSPRHLFAKHVSNLGLCS